MATPIYRDNAPAEDEIYLFGSEVARLFDVSPKTVARWAKDGKLPHFRTLGGHRRYKLGEIRQIIRRLDSTSGGGADGR